MCDKQVNEILFINGKISYFCKSHSKEYHKNKKLKYGTCYDSDRYKDLIPKKIVELTV